MHTEEEKLSILEEFKRQDDFIKQHGMRALLKSFGPHKFESDPSHCKYDLSKIHTKTLLQWLNKCRKMYGEYDPYYDGRGTYIHMEQIKYELAKRPHIPNKIEGKLLRRLSSQIGRKATIRDLQVRGLL